MTEAAAKHILDDDDYICIFCKKPLPDNTVVMSNEMALEGIHPYEQNGVCRPCIETFQHYGWWLTAIDELCGLMNRLDRRLGVSKELIARELAFYLQTAEWPETEEQPEEQVG
jgi:hypothetical protein